MKNLAKLKLQQAQAKGKTKPMASARTARAVPQMRKVVKALTGYKEGGTMENPKKRDRIKGRFEKMFQDAKDAREKKPGVKKGREKAKKLRNKFLDLGGQATGFVLEIIGKNRGGVIRPKPTFQGKVLKPKPMTRRGVGVAIRGFGKAFKKGR